MTPVISESFESQTLLMGSVRLLSLPADLEGLRSGAAYETLSHAALTPPPASFGGDCSSVPGSVSAFPEPPGHVPGFRIDGVIGHGGMGSVYLARQLSLDRPVALKVMGKNWTSDAVFVARFIREAYAAAQLNHPNVVQIYDIGEAKGVRYFSMEYVVGQSLADLLKQRGRLEPEVAVGYILQAARGLKHAHDRGIIHRDIKPDNLLLDQHGTVKVADLGLVKTPELSRYQDRLARTSGDVPPLEHGMTGVRMALGTPAYMAPEQCRDAATVDHRADIYSLGCTLYALVTGKQPFYAKSAFSLMKKHAYAELTPPERMNPRVPGVVSVVIQKMMAKHPGERYADTAEVIRILEDWLGVQSVGSKFAPTDAQIAEVEKLSAEFHGAPTATLRQGLIGAAVSGSALLAVLLLFFGQVHWSFGLASLVVQAAVVYFFLNGHSRRTYLFRRIANLARGMSLGEWIVAAGAVGLFAAFLWVSKLLILWAGFGMIGAAVAGAVWYLLDRKVTAERRSNGVRTRYLVEQLAAEGASGEEVRLFFAKYSGRHWEEYFESAFSYEDKLTTRNLLLRGGSAGVREKFAAWREPLVSVLNRIDHARNTARAAAAAPKPEPAGKDFADRLADWVVGTPVRAVLAALLIAATALWCIQNELWHAGFTAAEPLALEGVPANWTSWCDSANVGWGAMLLLASLFYRGPRMALLAVLGAGIAAFGHKLGIRTVEPIPAYHVAMLLGTVLALVGYRLGRR